MLCGWLGGKCEIGFGDCTKSRELRVGERKDGTGGWESREMRREKIWRWKRLFLSFLSFELRTIVNDGVFLDVQEGKKWFFSVVNGITKKTVIWVLSSR